MTGHGGGSANDRMVVRDERNGDVDDTFSLTRQVELVSGY